MQYLISFAIACFAFFLLHALIDITVNDAQSKKIFTFVLLLICLAIAFFGPQFIPFK